MPLVNSTYTGNARDNITGLESSSPDPTTFVSGVSWMKKRPGVLVSANSQGRIKVLEMA
jgi:hypothetical protein